MSCSSAALEAPVGKLYICPPALVSLTDVPGQFLDDDELTIPLGHWAKSFIEEPTSSLL